MTSKGFTRNGLILIADPLENRWILDSGECESSAWCLSGAPILPRKGWAGWATRLHENSNGEWGLVAIIRNINTRDHPAIDDPHYDSVFPTFGGRFITDIEMYISTATFPRRPPVQWRITKNDLILPLINESILDFAFSYDGGALTAAKKYIDSLEYQAHIPKLSPEHLHRI